ncbi:molybdopterin molybdotransferase MoeA [Marinomonas pollencensis]|uniref:Molybdopterin molybdenumtransferase n=1 Tax=Marinomonas pollencensis TaxID=491954 RepID=A0A3E0DTI3_9GAMM|nr:molybdopterin molybdotransferase MoeA [Marinomonas pollencensis]REG86853.1 molybdopterin molybdochelatase [Marinomonas pollencensis]
MMSELLPFEEALAAMENIQSTPPNEEQIELNKALGRITCNDIIATSFVPPDDNSAMDGYAFRFCDWSPEKVFPISQRVPAGQAPAPLEEGTCARIFTGANIPKGADTVIMQEEAQPQEAGILFPHAKANSNIRPQGQDIKKGQVIIHKGTKITPMHIGLLSSLGQTKVSVFCPLKVGILTTGDELIPAGNTLAEGQIFNSNGPMLSALITQAGYQVSQCLHAKDSPQATESAIQTLLECSDVILSSGGVSVGEEDHVKTVLEKLGKVHLWKIAIKPGKPLVHATLGNTPFLGLPGNPSSTLVTYHWFARRLLARCAGQENLFDISYPVDAGFNRSKTIKRDEFLRVSISSDGLAYAHPQQSSGALIAACESQGYLHIKAHTPIEYGCSYAFYPFSGF